MYLIWEGDHRPPEIRQELRTLDGIQCKLKSKERIIVLLEQGLEKAQRVGGEGASQVRKLWERNLEKKDLRQALALLSYDLDQFAAKIDQVASKSSTEVKACKKLLSSNVVRLMERADSLIDSFKKGE